MREIDHSLNIQTDFPIWCPLEDEQEAPEEEPLFGVNIREAIKAFTKDPGPVFEE